MNLRTPEPPYLELSFYSRRQNESETLLRIVESSLAKGAQLEGKVYVHHGNGLRDKAFASITDQVLVPLPLSSATQLKDYMSDPDLRVVQITLTGLFSENELNLATRVSISQQASVHDHHPLAIWLHDLVWHGLPEGSLDEEEVAKAGAAVYQRFKEFVLELQPSYAAITVEYSLECPFDLKYDPRTYAFKDFYVSAAYLRSEHMDVLREVFRKAYLEELEQGLYVSTTRYFNPDYVSVDTSQVLANSSRIGGLLGSAVSYNDIKNEE